jgi:hypothetical protein
MCGAAAPLYIFLVMGDSSCMGIACTIHLQLLVSLCGVCKNWKVKIQEIMR